MSNDQQLIQLAEAFVVAFRDARVKNKVDFHALLMGQKKGFSTSEYGAVEFTSALVSASRDLSARATKVFGSSRIHQKSVEEVARSVAFSSANADTVKAVAKAVVVGITNAANTEYRIIRPNRLFRFRGDVEELQLGPVRITTREAIRQDVAKQSSAIHISPVGRDNSPFSLIEDGTSLTSHIHLPDYCWDVGVKGMPMGLELQAHWLIDVATSFARLHYKEQKGLFPGLSDIEPHPTYLNQVHSHGLTLGPEGPTFGTSAAPPWYEVDADMVEILKSPKVIEAAEQVFNPKSGTLAERMQQALGWLTRARRAHEPAERVLLFFTTIEALLSGPNKDSPVTETIARNAGVIWSAEPETRLSLYKTLKKHYDLRSRIVHNGERSVAQIEANNVHYIAWTITQIVLRRANLAAKHEDFFAMLREASFGAKLDFQPSDEWQSRQ